MSNVAIDLTKTVKEIITTMKTAIDNLNTDVSSNKTAIDNLNTDVSSNKTAIDNLKGQVLQAVYPVGSVYVSITDSRDPADILGFGTWEALPAGYGLVAQGTATAEDGSTLTFTAGQKSGEFKHQITVGEMAYTKAYLKYKDGVSPITVSCTGEGTKVLNISNFNWSKNNSPASGGNVFISFGNDQHHNNISPGIAVYGWRRIS